MNRQRFAIALGMAVIAFWIVTGLHAHWTAFILCITLCGLVYLRAHRRTRERLKIRKALPEGHQTSRNIPQSLKYEVMQASDGWCGLCNKRIEPGEEVEVDHKTPWSLGGETTRDNLWVVHRTCNRVKGNRIDNGAISVQV